MIRSYCNKRKAATAPEPEPGAVDGRLRPHCEFCPTEFDSDTDVEVHREVVHAAQVARAARHPHACPVCACRLPSAEARARHVRSRHLLAAGTRVPHPLYACDACDMLYFNRGLLVYHMRCQHEYLPRTEKLECAQCGRRVMVASYLSHLGNVHERSVRACPLCLLAVPDMRAGLLAHVRAAHAPRHACALCLHESAGAARLRAHMESEHGRRSTPGPLYPTEQMGRFFVRGGRRRSQRYRAPLPERGLDLRGALGVCVLCQEVCETAEDQQRHIAAVHGHRRRARSPEPAPPSPAAGKQCGACAATFTNDVMLRHHVFKEHGERVSSGGESPTEAWGGVADDIVCEWD